MAPSAATEPNAAAEADATAETKDNHQHTILSNSSPETHKLITKGVLRAKLAKRRHLVVPQAISPTFLDTLMPRIVTDLFEPQNVTYNGGVANIKQWKIS